ncbi:MAG: hypothetical protein J1E35_01805 [Lachnospiraceae bacterium]|nr:hypothetical protein [Lachnospiraceae bacterium]
MSGVTNAFMEHPEDKKLAESVYEGINHQMSFYSAIYLVMPYLVKLLEQKISSGDTEWAEYCLFNIGMTIASDNWITRRGYKKEKVPDDLKKNYKLCLKKVRKIAGYFYKENKSKLKHKEESSIAKLAFKGFRILVYEFVIHV